MERDQDRDKYREAFRKTRQRLDQLRATVDDVDWSGQVRSPGEDLYRLEVLQEQLELLHGDVSRLLLYLSRSI